jgi:hypothetical protein
MADTEPRTSHWTLKFGVSTRTCGLIRTQIGLCYHTIGKGLFKLVELFVLFGSYILISRSALRFLCSHGPLCANRLQRVLCTKFRHCLFVEAESTATHIAVEPCNYDFTGNFVCTLRRVMSRYRGDVRFTLACCPSASVTRH